MTDQSTPLDDATRPKAPPIPGATAEERSRGRHLAMIHRGHLQQMAEVRRVMQAVERQERPASDLAPAAAGLDMTANYRRFGRLCGEECAMLTFHHSAESSELFPALMGRSAGLDRVVERLQAEHDVIHGQLVRFDAGIAAVMATPDAAAFAALKATFAELERVVRSHFGYEETELEEALGHYGFF